MLPSRSVPSATRASDGKAAADSPGAAGMIARPPPPLLPFMGSTLALEPLSSIVTPTPCTPTSLISSLTSSGSGSTLQSDCSCFCAAPSLLPVPSQSIVAASAWSPLPLPCGMACASCSASLAQLSTNNTSSHTSASCIPRCLAATSAVPPASRQQSTICVSIAWLSRSGSEATSRDSSTWRMSAMRATLSVASSRITAASRCVTRPGPLSNSGSTPPDSADIEAAAACPEDRPSAPTSGGRATGAASLGNGATPRGMCL
mmetsp:Transcript_35982/g.106356  ORF Transcript_35982/g.106356 Transcript_35982/m.106356 type:complete len:260 (-) Transcript_35982:105-884(-)